MPHTAEAQPPQAPAPKPMAARVPRREFVPKKWRSQANEDHPLPIGYGQTISQPSLVDEMVAELQLEPTDRVLEIGAGSGYQAALLAQYAAEVYTVEIIPQLAEEATDRLKRLGYDNVKVKCGDGYEGWAEYAPFDAITLAAAVEVLPLPLVEQLAEGGRILYPLGAAGGVQTLIKGVKVNGVLNRQELCKVRFVPFTRQE